LTPRISKRKFLIAAAGGITAIGAGYLAKENWISNQPYSDNFTSNKKETTNSDQTKSSVLPPGQREIDAIMKWNIDHRGIIPTNPKFDPDKWILTVDGEVKNQSALNWQEFSELPSTESMNDFHCVEGWSVRNCKWYGVKFKTLTELVKPKEEAKYIFIECADGYSTSLVLKDLLKDNVLLATRLNDKTLEESLGGPMRLIVPDKYGYKSAMWIERINFTDKKELGYWEKFGHSYTADVWMNDRFEKMNS
jgi:DMSO/TMAO reductase YedYZ molybdopterin-dependent catalytic subunit